MVKPLRNDKDLRFQDNEVTTKAAPISFNHDAILANLFHVNIEAGMPRLFQQQKPRQSKQVTEIQIIPIEQLKQRD